MDYADSFTLPDADEEGVFLDEGAPDCGSGGDCPGRTGRGLQGLRDNFRGDRRYEETAASFRGGPARPAGREGFYGNIVSDRRGRPAADWDERPPRGGTHTYGDANAPDEWFHLVPPYASRPYGGGPAPSLAYPIPAPGRGAELGPLNGPGSVNLPTGRECFSEGRDCERRDRERRDLEKRDRGSIHITFPQIGIIVLLFVAVVLLALVLRSAGKIIGCLENTVLATAEACNAVSVWGRMAAKPQLAAPSAPVAT